MYLRNLEQQNHQAFKELSERGFGCSITGQNFSTLHGDLITEIFNGQTKRQAGPHRTGLSMDIDQTNRWIKTVHIYAKLRMEVTQKIGSATSAVHKETTPSAIKQHLSHVESLKQQLTKYGCNPFSDSNAKNITTGAEIDTNIIAGLLSAPDVGNEKFLTFARERLVLGTVNFYTPIEREGIDTGLKKKKKKSKASSILKEDLQAFGWMLCNSKDLKVIFDYLLSKCLKITPVYCVARAYFNYFAQA